jgi:hypothetical protein
MSAQPPCVLGIAPHSGWAAVVIVGGTAAAPRVLLRERVELADARLPGSKQPYHDIEGLALPAARARLARFEESANRLALGALRTLTAAVRDIGAEARAAGILASSGRVGATLEATLGSHALIHTADGNHFRDALAHGCEALELAVTRVTHKALPARAAVTLRKSPAALAATLATLGSALGAPWGADQKSAALLAWLLL